MTTFTRNDIAIVVMITVAIVMVALAIAFSVEAITLPAAVDYTIDPLANQLGSIATK